MPDERLFDALVRRVETEPDWGETCDLAAMCFPPRKGEVAARYALAKPELVQWLAAWGKVTSEARRFRAAAERYQALFREQWAAGKFDIVAVDHHLIEERKLPRGMAQDPECVIDFEKGAIRLGNAARFGNCRVVASAAAEDCVLLGGTVRSGRTGGRPPNLGKVVTDWWNSLSPEERRASYSANARIWMTLADGKPPYPGDEGSIRKIISKLAREKPG